jgi:hypothetical protein
MYKVIIAGCRDFTDYPLLCSFADQTLAGAEDIEIVSGGARGTDALGERYARERRYGLKVFPAEWKKWGAAAGPIRNGQMAGYADALIAFWDGQSAGTRDMIRKAEENGLCVQVRMI